MNFGVIAGYRIKYRSSPVPNRYGSPYSGTGLVKTSESLFIPVPECPGAVCRAVQHLAFLKHFRRWKGIHPARHHTWLLLALCMMLKNHKWMPECLGKSQSSIVIFTVSQLPQSGIGILTSGSVWYQSGITHSLLLCRCPANAYKVASKLNRMQPWSEECSIARRVTHIARSVKRSSVGTSVAQKGATQLHEDAS
jgi:hypothetical protein